METPTAPLSIRRVPLDSLRLDPANARQHPERNLDSIRSSLQRFHQAEPLVVQKSIGRVIGGNGRVVMRSLGWSECDVVEVDVDDLTATALGIALNRTSDLAEWDLSALGRLLESLREEDALEGVGFDETEIAELLASLDAELGDVLGVEEDGAPSTERPANRFPLTRAPGSRGAGDVPDRAGLSTTLGPYQRLAESSRLRRARDAPNGRGSARGTRSHAGEQRLRAQAPRQPQVAHGRGLASIPRTAPAKPLRQPPRAPVCLLPSPVAPRSGLEPSLCG